jgi:hypothetical protein
MAPVKSSTLARDLGENADRLLNQLAQSLMSAAKMLCGRRVKLRTPSQPRLQPRSQLLDGQSRRLAGPSRSGSVRTPCELLGTRVVVRAAAREDRTAERKTRCAVIAYPP